MAINTGSVLHTDMLSSVLEEHSEWFCNLIKYIFYSSESGLSEGVSRPSSFADWIVHVNRGDDVQPEIIEKLMALHSDLMKIADLLVHTVRGDDDKPRKQDFENFVTVYEEFMLYLSRLDQNISLEGAGYDAFTGLKHKKVLNTDIQRELDRLARQGKSFCIALAKIDSYQEMRTVLQRDEVDGYVKLVAGLIKLSIRSFDDAYYMGENKFLLCLKQAELSGGISALDRLRRELEAQRIFVSLDSGEKHLSLSCCIAEPCIGDDVQDLIEHLNRDLESKEQERSDTVLKYHEMSPLERFAKQGR